MKNASEAMDGLDALRALINENVYQLHTHITRAEKDWEGLKKAGGGRDDHAAEHLKSILKSVDLYTAIMSDVQTQLQHHIADPFGDKPVMPPAPAIIPEMAHLQAAFKGYLAEALAATNETDRKSALEDAAAVGEAIGAIENGLNRDRYPPEHLDNLALSTEDYHE